MIDNEYSGARHRFFKKNTGSCAIRRGPAEGKTQEREERPTEVMSFGSRKAILCAGGGIVFGEKWKFIYSER